MKIPLTQKILMDWAGPRVFHYGKSLFDSNRVRNVEYTPPYISGELEYGSRGMNCRFQILPDGSAANQCPCRDSTERGIICAHVVALGLELIRRHADPEKERKVEEEKRRVVRLARMNDNAYIRRVPEKTPGAVPAQIYLSLPESWRHDLGGGKVTAHVFIRYNKHDIPISTVPLDIAFTFNKQDEMLLLLLEDIAGGPMKDTVEISKTDFINVLNHSKDKKFAILGQSGIITVNTTTLASTLKMDLSRQTGELQLEVRTTVPGDNQADITYFALGNSGWIYAQNQFWPLANPLPVPLQGIYDHPIVIQRPSVPRFIRTELPLLEDNIKVETDITGDLFSIEPAIPSFKLVLRGSPASLSANLYAEYSGEGLSLIACKPDPAGKFALPDSNDILHYTIRNLDWETAALARLGGMGLLGERGDAIAPIVGCHQVLNFLGGTIPRLRRMGWNIVLEGKIEPFLKGIDYAKPIINITEANSLGWFDVNFSYENSSGQSINELEVQRSLMKGDYYIEKNGRTFLLDADAISTMRDVFADCSVRDSDISGHFRMNGIYSAYVHSSLAALDGVEIKSPQPWLNHAIRQNRGQAIEPIPINERMDKILRPYQKDGLYWLNFLEKNMLCGILADEMGLGKTVQALAWIELNRIHPEAANKPALIICPTSLVENWAEECEKFVPQVKVLLLSGSERHERWEAIKQANVVVTSYALMRRDIEKYTEYEFSTVILDEAQHIKNSSTQNSVAAKRLRAIHRLVLTGTPIENSVSDLWSIMDFLMPGYLGSHQSFRENYELPIAHGGPEAEAAQSKLRRKMHPFLLRRLKSDVARDLPPKIEKIASCTLSADQQLVYRQLLESSRQRLADLVLKDGFARSRMEILKTLLRLRQICCHLDLLKLPDLKSKYPSAKMDLFFELLDEALDAGHRVLVFSQFTSMLAILRRELVQRDRQFCYLDGATKDRLSIVKKFNTDHSIPVFLISLKAGGTGLNLTGADMVMHFDPWWNPAVEDQATDRAYRIGQKKTVYSIKLISKGTVEEKVLALQKKKKSTIDATLTKDDDFTHSLTWEDVQELLSL